MTKTRNILAGVAILMAFAGDVRAQSQNQTLPPTPQMFFVNVNVGAQPQTRSIDKSSTFSLYSETASVSSTQAIGSGAIFDVSGGYRVWRMLAVGIGFSNFGKSSDSSIVAIIPNPFVFDQPKTSTATQTGLEHKEHGVHLQAVWFIPITDKVDVSVFGGPSFIRVSQQVVSSITVATGTQDINAPGVTTEEGTAKGGNIGFDANYFFTKNFGAGLFMRYAGGSIDLPSAPDLHVGGFQIGVGARVRY
jgi:hypothetical protein